jgi:uncharacterized protein
MSSFHRVVESRGARKRHFKIGDGYFGKRCQKVMVCLLLVAQGVCLSSANEIRDLGKPVLAPPKKAQYAFGGIMGKRIQANLDNWLLTAPVANPGMLEMFRVRDRKPVPKIVPWAGEFVGKYLISAIQARRMCYDADLDKIIGKVIKDLLDAQADDGYLGPFRKEERLLGHWDLWGHYHILQALLMWHADTGDQQAWEGALSAADLICRIYVDTPRRPLEAGSDEMNLSIIHALGRLYRKSGNERHLRLMRKIEEDWESAGDYFRQGLAGNDFYKLPRRRWESLHCIQGLAELYYITGNQDYRKAFINLWESIARFDRHNTGGFSTGEAAIGNPYTSGAIETCCTTAWSALSVDMLLLTGESKVADELEWSLWNSILGSQHPTGRWWTYDTPMDGKRKASAHSIVFQARAGTAELNCCSVNAPRGLGMIADWGLLTNAEGALVVNYYGPFEAELDLQKSGRIEVHQVTEYPSDGKVLLRLWPAQPVRLPILLRIPVWSIRTSVKTKDTLTLRPKPGTYCRIDREWRAGDSIELELDMSLRTWYGDGPCLGRVSLFRGPILLAYDQHYNELDTHQAPKLNYQNLGYERVETGQDLLDPILLLQYEGINGRSAFLCDFASAGAYGTEYISWLPVNMAPPPPFYLLEPRDKSRIPDGPTMFQWSGSNQDDSRKYTFLLADNPAMSEPLVTQTGLIKTRYILRKALSGGREYYWQVISENCHGRRVNEINPRSFVIDKELPNPFVDHPALLDYRADGLITGALLRGQGDPIYGYLDTCLNVAAAAGRDGIANSAIQLSGAGMLKYRIPDFPRQDYTFITWICPGQTQKHSLAQVFSAWARGGDDPLRVVIDKGYLYARIEGNGGASTKGYPIQPGKWIQVAAVKQGSQLRLYINGELYSSVSAPRELLHTSARDFAIGGNPNYSGPEFFHGRIQEFGFWEKALDKVKIKDMFSLDFESMLQADK